MAIPTPTNITTPCSNCKESILNKTPTIIKSPLCQNDCPDDYICLDIIQAKCVSIQGREDCITDAETVQGQIDNIREYVCAHSSGDGANCPCPVGTYTITGVCTTFLNEAPVFNLLVTPNFTWAYPTTLFVTANTDSNSAPPFLTGNHNVGAYFNTVDSVTSGTELPLDNAPFTLVFIGGYSPQDSGILTFQITDNRGNYSNKYSVAYGDIPTCG